MGKTKSFILKHADFFTFLGLCILFYFIFFHNIWSYALMDVDESRYVSMSKDMYNSKDFLTLHLNNSLFFEKPPLFFWGECLSFALFGKITEATARFPVSLYGTLSCFALYFLGKKVVSRNYGAISSLMLATSLEFLILAKYAAIDILLAACICLSLCFGIMTNYCAERNKKYMWWLFYVFSGLAVMAKGLPGFVIPFGSMFFISLYSGKIKEIFRLQYLFVGMVLFLLIVLPWHIAMFRMHNPMFFQEYIVTHHLARFLGSEELRRQQPFYFYFLTILWGFFPWIVSVLTVFVRKCIKRDIRLREMDNAKRLVVYSGITAVFTIIFFSLSETKLITYILPVYPMLALLGGYIWTNYTERGEYSRFIDKTVYFLGVIFVITGIAAIFTFTFLPPELNADIAQAKPVSIILLLLCGVLSMVFCKKGKYGAVFFVYVIFMAGLSAFGTEKFYKVDYTFGQNDLMEIAQYMKVHNKTVTCYQFTHKYSLRYYSDRDDAPLVFGMGYGLPQLRRELKKPNNLVIIQKKAVNKNVKKLNYKVVYKGRRYLLIEGIETDTKG